VRLRPNRGFPRGLACDVIPDKSVIESITVCAGIDILRQKARRGKMRQAGSGALN
jgi:hypothetical protein